LMTHVIASHYNISQLVPLLRQADHKALIAWERYMHETAHAVYSTIRRRQRIRQMKLPRSTSSLVGRRL
jgi:hypothetical protein